MLHPAVDNTAPAGAVICSVLDGTVIFSDWTDANGYSIAIQHESGIISFYKHNQKLLRKAGEKVSAGTPVALVGNTGTLVEGDHLHLEGTHVTQKHSQVKTDGLGERILSWGVQCLVHHEHLCSSIIL